MAQYDYIVVGSGAGGGPLAANLARRGFRVLLLEAGVDVCTASDLGKLIYEVPIFHGLSTEHPECAWDYYVNHFSDETQAKKDSKYDEEGQGVWYPRAATLGGCTSHNAMITVTPQAVDWDWIARTTGDWSWLATNMNKYFARLENAQYVPRPSSLRYTLNGIAWSILAFLRREKDTGDWSHGHGFKGWLTTSMADPRLLLPDRTILKLLQNAVSFAIQRRVGSLFTRVVTKFDPNDIRNGDDGPEGVALTPLAVAAGKRNGPRDFVLKTQREYPDKLTIRYDCLVTRVLFEDKRAVGVELRHGKRQYSADPRKKQEGAGAHVVEQEYAQREVILAAGAFNSPQLLKLSGIGPADELKRHGIEVLVDLPGVGENLQDRYEVGVVTEVPHPFELLKGATFLPPDKPDGEANDPFLSEWQRGKGLYASNGSLLGILKRSSPDMPEADLYIFALPGYFRGYKKGYSREIEHYGNRFTWAILKAYTNNRAGRVTLRSSDPTESPRIDFHYFEEGSDETGSDLEAVVNGVEFVRSMNERLGKSVQAELLPGPGCRTRDSVREWVRNEAWGHHASCTNKIGHVSDRMAVLDSHFRVRGVSNLRVVDASVFPRIPGYFIVSAVYMISEKAADVIVADADLTHSRGEVPRNLAPKRLEASIVEA